MERLLEASASLINGSRERALVGTHPYLSGLFAPTVEDLQSAPLSLLEGSLPAERQGTFSRATLSSAWRPCGGRQGRRFALLHYSTS